MTDRELAGCPFCGGKNVEAHHAGTITYLLCGDQYGRGGCGAVVSFRPNLAGSAAIAAWNRRTPSSERDGSDGERLLYLAKDGCVEGFRHVKADIYDYACDAAEESGRDEPNDADMLYGMRRLIDAAIASAAAPPD